MARYKPDDRHGMVIPVDFAKQIPPGAFEFALDHPVDYALELAALDARFCNDATGTPV